MAALTRDRNTVRRELVLFRFPVAAGVICRAGGIAVLDDGYVRPGFASEGLQSVGCFQATVDNIDGQDGDVFCEVHGGTDAFIYADAADVRAISRSDIGEFAFIVDDQTVSITPTGRSAAGMIADVDDAGVHVSFAPLPLTLAATQARVQEVAQTLALAGLVVHYEAGGTQVAAAAAPDGEAEVVAMANAVKAAYVAHLANTDLHSAADVTNTIAADDATNLATSYALLNELKDDFNAHVATFDIHRSPTGAPRTILSADASSAGTAEALAFELARKFNMHSASGIGGTP